MTARSFSTARPSSSPARIKDLFSRNLLSFPGARCWITSFWGLSFKVSVTGKRRQKAERYIALVGLAGFEQHYPHELSGGMQQRVNLARALIVDPQVLLMDEPFAALDAQTREIMQAELLKMWNQTKKTVIFVTHQIEEAIFLSDRVVVFSARPAKIREIVKVDIRRPRSLKVKRNKEFLDLADHVWGIIQEEVLKSMGREREEGIL